MLKLQRRNIFIVFDLDGVYELRLGPVSGVVRELSLPRVRLWDVLVGHGLKRLRGVLGGYLHRRRFTLRFVRCGILRKQRGLGLLH